MALVALTGKKEAMLIPEHLTLSLQNVGMMWSCMKRGGEQGHAKFASVREFTLV